MILDWKGKIAARPWVRTVTQGLTQVFTRVLGTTVVVPPTPRVLSYVSSRSNTPSYVSSRSNTPSYRSSES